MRVGVFYFPTDYGIDIAELARALEERGFDYPIAHVRWSEQRNLEAILELLAAKRGGIKTVFIPIENKKDLTEVPKSVLRSVEVILVEQVDEIWRHAFIEGADVWAQPEPAQEVEAPAKKSPAKKAPAKKAPAKKAPAKKTPAKTAPAKKTTSKKSGQGEA